MSDIKSVVRDLVGAVIVSPFLFTYTVMSTLVWWVYLVVTAGEVGSEWLFALMLLTGWAPALVITLLAPFAAIYYAFAVLLL